MHAPLPELLVSDARRFGERLPAFAPRLGRPAPEPVTGRIGKSLLVYAERAMTAVSDLREHLLDRIAERTCPWWLRPVPSATVVAFEPAESPIALPASTTLTSRPLEGVPCSFRTLRALRIGPYHVASALVVAPPGARPIVHIVLESQGSLAEACGDELSLYVGGDRESALALVHALTTSARGLSWQSTSWSEPLSLPVTCITRPGFAPDEALAPDPDGLPSSFGIVTEAHVAPDKFRFMRIVGLDALRERSATTRATLTIVLSDSTALREEEIDVRAHCVPVVNLFDATTENVALDFSRRPERLRVSGLGARHGGIYAVRDVHATDRATLKPVRLPDRRRHTADAASPMAPAVFAVTRELEDGALRVHFAPRPSSTPGRFVVSARVLATNRGHAAKLRTGELSGVVSTPAGELRYAAVAGASPFIERPTGGAFVRRVLSEATVRKPPTDPLRALRHALTLTFPSWALTDERGATFQSQLDKLSKLDVRLARRETRTRAVQAGYRYELTVDEMSFVGPGEQGLFGAALAEALARCLPLSSFLELVVTGSKTGISTTFVRGVLA